MIFNFYAISVLRDDGEQLWLALDRETGIETFIPFRTCAHFFPSAADARIHLRRAMSPNFLHGASGCFNQKPVRTVTFSIHEVSWIQTGDIEVVTVDINKTHPRRPL